MRRASFIAWVTVGVSVLLNATTAAAQSNAAEQAIRAQIEKRDGRGADSVYRKESIFWSGAYSKPQVTGRAVNPTELLAAPGRKNVLGKTQVEKIVVATSGDMAYEYSTFTLAFDDDTGHHDRKGAVLCVWQRVDGQWLTAAEFRRPYGAIAPDEQNR
jgi:ketosteroid isomerase-like protein